jgi:hypothetical protein
MSCAWRCGASKEVAMIAEELQAQGMLDLMPLDPSGLARCYGCGWIGVPTSIRGVPSTHCPACEKEPDEEMLALGIPVVRAPKQGRNELCNCGSGKKAKRCCLR